MKICCIHSLVEARLAIQMGADALGLVGRMPSGPSVISDESIRIIAGEVPRAVNTFLLTSETRANAVSGYVPTPTKSSTK